MPDTKKVKCRDCNGTGSEPLYSGQSVDIIGLCLVSCRICGGSGVREKRIERYYSTGKQTLVEGK